MIGCNSSEDSSPLLPDQLSALPLMKRLAGDEAAALIERLHAKSVAPVASEIGYYGAATPPLTVYVSRFSSPGEAHEQIAAMVEMIGAGSSGFAHPAREMRGDTEVHLVVGHGQSHAYFVYHDLVYWVAASRDAITDALEELLAKKRE